MAVLKNADRRQIACPTETADISVRKFLIYSQVFEQRELGKGVTRVR